MWTDEDRRKWETWHVEAPHRCSRCSSFDWEWEQEKSPWVADLDMCPGCHALDSKLAGVQGGKQSLHGMSVRLFRNG